MLLAPVASGSDTPFLIHLPSVSLPVPKRPMLRRLLLGLLVLVLGPMAHAQSTPALDLSLHLAAAEVRQAGALRIAVVFRNADAAQAMSLRGQPAFEESGGLHLSVIDAIGTRRTVALQPNATSLPARNADERVQLLPPDHGVSVHRRVAAAELFPGPGRYSLEVSYTPPPASAVPLAPGSVDAGPAISGRVEVEVTE